MTTHTPGPWEIERGHVWAKSNGASIARFDGCTNAANNARLIAAAPECYEAVCLAVESAGPLDASDECSDIVISRTAYKALCAAIDEYKS